MKIAICLSGHLRSHDLSKNSLHELISYLKNAGHSVDVFLTTWDKREAKSSWAESHGLISPRQDIDSNYIASHYNATSYTIFNDDFYSSELSPLSFKMFRDVDIEQVANDKRTYDNNIGHVTKMLFLSWECLKLKKYFEFKSNELFDLVIKTRPEAIFDLNLFKMFNLEDLLIKYPDGNFVCTKVMSHQPAIKDKTVFGGNLGIDRYMSAFFHLQKSYLQNEWPSGEMAHGNSLINLNVNIIDTPEWSMLTNNSIPNFLR